MHNGRKDAKNHSEHGSSSFGYQVVTAEMGKLVTSHLDEVDETECLQSRSGDEIDEIWLASLHPVPPIRFYDYVLSA